MLQPPLNQFAARLINNHELRTFIQGLMEMGVSERQLLEAMKPEDKGPESNAVIFAWYKRVMMDICEVTDHATMRRARPNPNIQAPPYKMTNPA